ncbi:hypothetical protein COO72_11335 [Bifidobacterium callitrichos]|nr:hypothetical protein COO72_11335 [Bifidobacterium callitrichos]
MVRHRGVRAARRVDLLPSPRPRYGRLRHARPARRRACRRLPDRRHRVHPRPGRAHVRRAYRRVPVRGARRPGTWPDTRPDRGNRPVRLLRAVPRVPDLHDVDRQGLPAHAVPRAVAGHGRRSRAHPPHRAAIAPFRRRVHGPVDPHRADHDDRPVRDGPHPVLPAVDARGPRGPARRARLRARCGPDRDGRVPGGGARPPACGPRGSEPAAGRADADDRPVRARSPGRRDRRRTRRHRPRQPCAVRGHGRSLQPVPRRPGHPVFATRSGGHRRLREGVGGDGPASPGLLHQRVRRARIGLVLAEAHAPEHHRPGDRARRAATRCARGDRQPHLVPDRQRDQPAVLPYARIPREHGRPVARLCAVGILAIGPGAQRAHAHRVMDVPDADVPAVPSAAAGEVGRTGGGAARRHAHRAAGRLRGAARVVPPVAAAQRDLHPAQTHRQPVHAVGARRHPVHDRPVRVPAGRAGRDGLAGPEGQERQGPEGRERQSEERRRRSMNRGLILNLISNLAFFVSGYAIHFFLGGFASPAAYGVVGTVITVLDIEYLFVSNGARQSLSRTLSAGRYDPRDVVAKTLAVQMAIVAVFVLIDVAGAPVFGRVLGDRSLDLYMRLAAFLVPANGLYVVMLGINDGLRRFGHSALLSTMYPLVKLGTIPLIMFVFPDRPVIGVEVGYCASMILVIVIGALMLAPYLIASRRQARGGSRDKVRLPRIGWREAAHGTLAFSLFFIMASLVLSADTLVVKAVLPDGMAGFYTGAMNFGKTTYYLLQAFAVIILPVVAGLIGERRRDEALGRARDLVLLAVVFILPMAVSISATATDLLSSFYSRQFAVAAPALSCLALSSFFMGATVVLNMVLNAERDTRFSDVLSAVSLPVVVIAFVVAARLGGITAVAAVSMGSTFLTMTVSYFEVRRRFGDVMSATAWRAVGVNVVLWIVMAALGAVLPDRNFIVLVFVYMLEYATYLTLLVAMGILDLKRIRQFAAGLGHSRGEDGVRTVPNVSNVPNVPSSAAGVDGAAR